MDTSTAIVAGYVRSGGSSWNIRRMHTLQRLSVFIQEQFKKGTIAVSGVSRCAVQRNHLEGGAVIVFGQFSEHRQNYILP